MHACTQARAHRHEHTHAGIRIVGLAEDGPAAKSGTVKVGDSVIFRTCSDLLMIISSKSTRARTCAHARICTHMHVCMQVGDEVISVDGWAVRAIKGVTCMQVRVPIYLATGRDRKIRLLLCMLCAHAHAYLHGFR